VLFFEQFPCAVRTSFVGSRSAASLSAQSSQLDGGLIPRIRLGVRGLPGSNVSNHLHEREGIARAFLPPFRDATIVANSARGRIADSRYENFKVTHCADWR